MTEPKKIWANSGDAHFIEPDDLFVNRLPAELAARMPRREAVDDQTEIIHIDGESYTMKMAYRPKMTAEYVEQHGLDRSLIGTPIQARWPMQGIRDLEARLADLDKEGIWGEVVYASVGLWNGLIRSPDLYREGVRAYNDWLKETFIDATSRCVPTAHVSILSVDDAVAEVERVAGLGFKALSLPTTLAEVPNWNDSSWEPLWAAAEAAGLVLAVHIGGDKREPGDIRQNQYYRGPGGAILNYVETTYGGQRCTTMLVASGALDRHPNLKVLISEGGATWVPFIGDRMEEAYRQHGSFVRPSLSRSPREILYSQVYASFQHDKTAIQAMTAMGYNNVVWGSDYPHAEGTYGHTQEVLHDMFDDVDEDVTYRITRGAFLELFPHVGEPQTELASANA